MRCGRLPLCGLLLGRHGQVVDAADARSGQAVVGWQLDRPSLDEVTTQPDDLDAVMATLKATNQAIGIIMVQHGCSAGEAFTILSRALLGRKVKVRDYLAQLVDQLSTTGVDATPSSDRNGDEQQ